MGYDVWRQFRLSFIGLTIMKRVRRHQSGGAWLLLTLSLAACGESAQEPSSEGPLAKLVAKTPVDSAGKGVPQPFSPQGAGAVRGTVIAPSAPGAGKDSLKTAPPIPGVVIRIFPVIGNPDVASPTLGPQLATVTTDANGRFQTPVVDGSQGWHVLTFTPPTGSGFQAVWARTQFWTQSLDTPWWLTLPRVP